MPGSAIAERAIAQRRGRWSEGAGAAEIAKLKAEAEKQINIADDYTQACGHDRRDEELAQLQAVLRGEKTLASLPPRV